MSEPTAYLGPIPTKHLSEFIDEICEAGVGELFDIVAWIDNIPHENFMVGELYSFTVSEEGKYITVTGRILEGTMVGNYPLLFDGGPRWFVRLLLKVEKVASIPQLKRLL